MAGARLCGPSLVLLLLVATLFLHGATSDETQTPATSVKLPEQEVASTIGEEQEGHWLPPAKLARHRHRRIRIPDVAEPVPARRRAGAWDGGHDTPVSPGHP